MVHGSGLHVCEAIRSTRAMRELVLRRGKIRTLSSKALVAVDHVARRRAREHLRRLGRMLTLVHRHHAVAYGR
jgi:hypothetical protein